jgi:ribonuclease E
VTCPRCNGTGHIRDTESSALQVLRIIQEEAMKENTAAIHCQVPVEVTAFLLNEKRAEINKIESRFKVNVVLIPNKHLDTPHYKLERLRHDDARLDDPRASWKMAEEAARELESETGYSKRTEEVKPKQEAAVKGITPEKPAPSAPVRPAATPAPVAVAPASGGFIGWLKNLFGMQPAAPAPVVTATPEKQTRPQRGERTERGERTGERGGDRNRNRRSGTGTRDAAVRGEGTAGGRQAQGQQPSQRREEREPREGREVREPREGREPREAREPRGTREPREAREGREPREAREPREGRENRERDNRGAERAETAEAAPRGERQERGERRERGDRADRGERRKPQAEGADALTQNEAQPAEELVQNQAALGENGAPVDQEAVAREGEERRRRRRGRRGGRREREEDVNGNLAADVAEAEGDTASTTDEAPVRAAHQPVERKPEAVEAQAVTPVEVVVAAVATETAVVSELHAATETPALAVEKAAKTETVVPVAPAAVEPVAETPVAQAAAEPAEAAQAVPAASETVSLVEPVAHVEAPASEPVEAPPVAPVVETQAAALAPVETAAPAAVVEAPAVQPAPQADIVEPQPVAATVTPAAEPAALEPAPIAVAPQAPQQAPRQGGVSAEALKPVLEQAGLVWVNTDADKLRAAQEAAAQTVKPARVVRERKPLPPVDSAPMQQVETDRHPQ